MLGKGKLFKFVFNFEKMEIWYLLEFINLDLLLVFIEYLNVYVYV